MHLIVSVLCFAAISACGRHENTDHFISIGINDCITASVEDNGDDYLYISVNNKETPSNGLLGPSCDFSNRIGRISPKVYIEMYVVKYDLLGKNNEVCPQYEVDLMNSFRDMIINYITFCGKGNANLPGRLKTLKPSDNPYDVVSEGKMAPFSKFNAFDNAAGLIEKQNFTSFPLGMYIDNQRKSVNIICVVQEINLKLEVIYNQIDHCLSGYNTALF
jgi:hypothetical protein